MARWTHWRKLADREYWYDDEFDYEGPACYELGIGGPRYGNLRQVYVGETANEKRRLSAYARNGSHLSEIIAIHLRKGWTLYYRAIAMPTKSAARRMQNDLLSKYDYGWNLQINSNEWSRIPHRWVPAGARPKVLEDFFATAQEASTRATKNQLSVR